MRDTRLNRSILTALLLIADVAVLNLSFWVGYLVFAALGYPVDFNTYLHLQHYSWTLPAVAFFFAGMCRSWDEYIFAKGIDSIISGVIGATLLLLLTTWLMRHDMALLQYYEALPSVDPAMLSRTVWGVPARVLVFVCLTSPLMIWMIHLVANEAERAFLGWSLKTRRLLVVGRLPAEDMARLERSRRPVYTLVGWIGSTDHEGGAARHLGGTDELVSVLEAESVNEVFAVTQDLSREALLDVCKACVARGIRLRLVLGVYETLIASTRPGLQGDIPLYRFRGGGIEGWTLVVKRLMDVALATFGLMVTVPLFIFPACVAIVVESKGWPVFSQTRVGLGGRHFRLFKLRTMVIDADTKGGPLTTDNDPRITRVGKFLRKSSIDELPQLWNVLRGDMSLVGPRAVVPFVADRFDDWERVSLAVRPGVTGLAQISGRDEIGFFEKSLLNLYYVRNHSILLDIRIVVDTVTVVLSMEGTEGTRGAAG